MIPGRFWRTNLRRLPEMLVTVSSPEVYLGKRTATMDQTERSTRHIQEAAYFKWEQAGRIDGDSLQF